MAERSVAYVVKGYPRRSELFIAGEIWRMERLGTTIRLIVLTLPDEDEHHAVVDDVRAVPSYLPATTSLSATRALPWLRANLRPFLPALRRVARRHPRRLARAAGMAAAQSWRARQGLRPRKVYLKELLQAVAVADRVEAAGDVVHLHAHFAHGATTVTWMAARLCDLPFSFTGHAKDLYRESLNPAGLLARKLRAAAFAVTCTGANAEHLRALGTGTPVHLVYHGLNPDFARLVGGARRPTAPNRFRVLGVGRMVDKKGFDVLVEAVGLLRDRGVDAELVLAGEDGAAAATIDAAVAHRHLGEVVRRTGPVSQPELLELLAGCSVFALACRVTADGDRDGIPNVLVEAMAAGVPVVSTRVSGIPELVTDGVDGVLVEPDDPVAMADALGRLAVDDVARRRLATAGRRTVADRFDGDALARELAALIGAVSKRSERAAAADRATAREPGGDGVWGRSPRGDGVPS
jgi:glycosyltransferase involved in cell wall biosynthesis